MILTIGARAMPCNDSRMAEELTHSDRPEWLGQLLHELGDELLVGRRVDVP